jgi:hypothetical protein
VSRSIRTPWRPKTPTEVRPPTSSSARSIRRLRCPEKPSELLPGRGRTTPTSLPGTPTTYGTPPTSECTKAGGRSLTDRTRGSYPSKRCAQSRAHWISDDRGCLSARTRVPGARRQRKPLVGTVAAGRSAYKHRAGYVHSLTRAPAPMAATDCVLAVHVFVRLCSSSCQGRWAEAVYDGEAELAQAIVVHTRRAIAAGALGLRRRRRRRHRGCGPRSNAQHESRGPARLRPIRT